MLNKESTTSFSSTTYLATLYVDFGLIGVLIGYLFIGSFIAFAEWLLYSNPKTPTRLVVAGLVGFYLGIMSLNGFIGFFSSFIVVLVVSLIFLGGVELRSMLLLIMRKGRHSLVEQV